MLLDDGLVARNQRLPVVGRHVGVEGIAAPILVGVERLLEMMMLDSEHHVRIHGDEAAIAVIGEPLIARALGKRLDGDVVEPEIEHGVHHAGHRRAGAGAHGDQERILRIAEGAAGKAADLIERPVDLRFQLRRIGLAVIVIIGAELGGDREPGRNRQPEIGHFREVGPLAAEQVLQPRIALRLAVTESIHPLRHRKTLWLDRFTLQTRRWWLEAYAAKTQPERLRFPVRGDRWRRRVMRCSD